jgi:hypothetical protein
MSCHLIFFAGSPVVQHGCARLMPKNGRCAFFPISFPTKLQENSCGTTGVLKTFVKQIDRVTVSSYHQEIVNFVSTVSKNKLES